MKTGGGKGQYFKPLIQALEAAGFEIARRSTSHFHYKAPGRPRITVPGKLDSIKTARNIATIAGVTLDA